METPRVHTLEEDLNLERAPKPVRSSFSLQDTSLSPNPRMILKELFELLEEYGPTWYTEELHHRARTALYGIQ